jgi:hypothetical protein
MANIIGEPFKKYVAKQINARQSAHGSGVEGNPRTPDYLSYLNSNTSWVKLASGVSINEERATKEGLIPSYTGDTLAKRHILFSGMSDKYGSDKIQQRGTNPDLSQNITDSHWGMYNVNATLKSPEYGLTPMPGIESAEIKSLNRGSIKRATVKIKCYSPEQFKIIDLLYLRIGYTVFLEWGNTLYLNSNVSNNPIATQAYTLIEHENGFFNYSKWKDQSYSGFLPYIESFRKARCGNYDGLLAKVVNFSWTFAQDGSYDIELQLISLGDVVESLKTNISPSYNTATFITQAYALYSNADDTEEDKDIPPSPADNAISAYLFMQKLFLDAENNAEGGYDSDARISEKQVTCKIQDTDIQLGGMFIKPPKDGTLTIKPSKIERYDFESREEVEAFVNSIAPGAKSYADYIELDKDNDVQISKYVASSNNPDEWMVTIVLYPELEITTEQGNKDVVYLNYNNGEDSEINDAGFYMRFGHLLDFLTQAVIPVISGTNSNGSEVPIVKIDNGMWNNRMYTLPYQVSLDPRVCIVNGGEKINSKDFFPQLLPWKSPDNGYAWHMNIYLSHNQILASLNASMDDKGNVSLFEFLADLCTALNKAMGGINNLEPILDEDTNTIHILDGSYAPKSKQHDYGLELFGYNPTFKSSNFVRQTEIKTEITNEFATMATIGSTAGGYVKGTENTMFSKWNKGLTDRWKEKFIPVDKTSRSEDGSEDEAKRSYVKEFWNQRYSALGYTLQDIADDVGDDGAGLNDELIDKNISIVSEFYKYAQFAIHQEKAKYSSPANGFIPINLSITMDGLSGIKIYNEINAVTRFLPSNYPDNLRFIIKGVNHKLQNQDWETNIETVVIAQTDDINSPALSYSEIKTIIDKLIASGIALVGDGSESSSGEAPGGAGNAIENLIYSSGTPKVNPPLETPSKSQTGSKLETSTKQAAITIFKNGEKLSQCGGYTYRIAEQLAIKLTKKSKFPGTGEGGNDAHSKVLRNHLRDLTIYTENSLTPVGSGLTKIEAVQKANQITKKANYGDVLIYFATPAPRGKKPDYRFHAQIYTGNQYNGTGWTTSVKNNYSVNFVYGGDKYKEEPYTMYWFRIKDEYKK